MSTDVISKPPKTRRWILAGFLLALLWLCLCVSSSILATVVTRKVQAPPAPEPLPSVSDPEILYTQIGNLSMSDQFLIMDGNGSLHLFWIEQTSSAGSLVHRQLDGSGGWSNTETVAADLKNSLSITIIVAKAPDGSACVFWTGEPVGTDIMIPYGIYWRCVLGQKWSQVNSTAGPADWYGRDFSPAFRPNGDLIFAYLKTNEDLYLGDTPLSTSGHIVERYMLATDTAGGCHSLWTEDRSTALHYRYSPDCQNWDPETALTTSTSEFKPGLNPHFDLCADRSGGVHVVWEGSDSVYYRMRTPDGNWSTEEIVDHATGLYLMDLHLTANSDGVPLIAWLKDLPASYSSGIFYSLKTGGQSWSDPIPVGYSSPDFSMMKLSAASEKGRVYFSWRRIYNSSTESKTDLVFLSLP